MINISEATSECEKSEQCQLEMLLVCEVQYAGVIRSMISISAAISACEKAEQWQ